MARKVTYNLVIESTDELVAGVLFTDKELEAVCKNKVSNVYYRQKPKTCKVKVYNADVYWCFGYRFATVYQEIIKD